ncbi:MAG: MBL fold metallo-hydrolase [Acidobacteria bacterium]|nr:MBL fold metallo-hydrolase [Acidobacteriota bacterium]
MQSRRGFFKSALGGVWTGAAVIDQALLRAVRARAQSTTLPDLFDFTKAADGVYLAVARPQTVLNSNAVIFENSRDLLIMDSHSKPSAVAVLVRQIRRQISEKPVRYVVASHFHWDHSHGLPAFRRIAPHADIVSSQVTRKLIDQETVPRLKASFDTLRASMDGYRKNAASAGSPGEKAHWDRMRRETDDYIREMQNFAPELPNVTVDRDLILHDKAHDLHLAFRGRGHTSGDVIVYCPQKKVVASGDLLHGFFPFLGDGYPLDWPTTLHHFAQFEFTHIAGGHGPLHERSRIYQMANYIEELTELVVRGKRAGKPQVQVEAEITPDKLKTLADGGYGRTTAESILKLRQWPPAKPAAETVIADTVKINVGHIFAALDKNP